MNDSQSSDILTQMSVEDNYTNDYAIGESLYQNLLHKVKESLDVGAAADNVLSPQLPEILCNCDSFITQSFNLITIFLENDTEVDELSSILENAINVLHSLSNLLCNVINSISSINIFSTTIGNIILSVFSHCKSSECLYSIHLHVVENQLKDLFRTCHELQLTYLSILHNHCLFNLEAEQEKEHLMECLLINLKICDVVQGLDVKTMAEHWKAFIAICEKYAQYISSTVIYDKCIKLLVASVKTNMLLKSYDDEKFVMRSIKVASFALKILSKLSCLFKNVSYDYSEVKELFFFILPYKNELFTEKALKFWNLIDSNIIVVSDALLKQLAIEEQFLRYIINLPVSEIHVSETLSYVLLMSSIFQHYPHDVSSFNCMKEPLMACVFAALHQCHVCFNINSKFKLINNKYCEVYEYLLVHTVSFASTFDSEQYERLEGRMLAGVLGADYCGALFASDMWVVLCSNNSQLQINTLTNIIRMQKKLDDSGILGAAPQRHHLTHMVQKLFKTMSFDEQVLIYRQFNVQDEGNKTIWFAMTPALPENIRSTAENILREKCLKFLKRFLVNKDIREDDLNLAIQYTKLMSCMSIERDKFELEDVLVKSWLKCCPSTRIIENDLSNQNVWYIQYINAIALWTSNFQNRFCKKSSIEKIVHVMSKILKEINCELTIIMFHLFYKFISQSEIKEIHMNTIEFVFLQIDHHTLEYLFCIATSDKSFDIFISQILNKTSLTEIRDRFINYKNNLTDDKWMSNLEKVCNNAYAHKCIKSSEDIDELPKSQNMDMNSKDSVEEPYSKRAKFDASVVEDVIVNMERDASYLLQHRNLMSEQQKDRISIVCEKLITMSE